MQWTQINALEMTDILKVLPHRAPFLLIDRVLEVKTAKPVQIGMSAEELENTRKGTYARTLKNVSFNEPQFQGHFPENPIFPGVLTIEVMAQTAVFTTVPYLAAINGGPLPKLIIALTGVDEMRFRKPIKPGDQMITTVTVSNVRGPLWSFEGSILVDGKPAAEGKLLAYLESGKKE